MEIVFSEKPKSGAKVADIEIPNVPFDVPEYVSWFIIISH